MKLYSAFILSTMVCLAGCDEVAVSPPTPQQVQQEKAAAAAKSITFTDNAEIENIKSRIKLTSQPGLLGYVLLLNQMGQPIQYLTVKGKITSSSKRLTPTVTNIRSDCGEFDCDNFQPGPSDEGTYGSSDPYIYFWDENGAYHQWNGMYLYSDKPIRTRVEPLVINQVATK